MSNRSNPDKQEKPTRRYLDLSLLGMAFAGVCILFITAFIWFQPDQLSLSDRYFPSPTATSTRTLTPTPTPNLIATQQAIWATETYQAIQTTIAHANNQWNILLSDNFISNQNLWNLGETDDDYAKIIRNIDNGNYAWEANSKKGFISTITANTKTVEDFLLEVEVQKTKGTKSSDYGLIFREDIGNNFYYFGIDDEGFFVSLYYNYKWIDLIDWTRSRALLPASTNRLAVIGAGSHFTFLINNQVVATVTNSSISRGTTGLAIQIHRSDRHAVFEFDNFELRAP